MGRANRNDNARVCIAICISPQGGTWGHLGAPGATWGGGARVHEGKGWLPKAIETLHPLDVREHGNRLEEHTTSIPSRTVNFCAEGCTQGKSSIPCSMDPTVRTVPKRTMNSKNV